MSEATAGAAGATGRTYIDDVCDFVRHTLESVGDAVTPPAEACQHFRESRIEFLRGVRSMIDHRIDHLSRKGQTGARVNVD